MKLLLTIIFCLITVTAVAGPIQDEILRVAPNYLGVRESWGQNKGPMVNKILANVGLPPGQPWCMSLVYTIHKDAYADLKLENPLPKTGLAAGYWISANKRKLTFKVIPAKLVMLGSPIDPADVAIWRHSAVKANGLFTGHAATVIHQIDKKTFESIEGNTGAGERGSQREGDGCYRRTRKLNVPSFLVMGFIRIR